jgi:SNF2 family DNA or RNA helicase
MQPLYEHQKKIIKEDKHKCGLFLGTGASKTRTALVMAEGPTLVICPKQQRDDETWQRENTKWETKKDLTVISKEDLRKRWKELPSYTTVIIDECHNNLGVLPQYYQKKNVQYLKTSQIFEATLGYIKKHNPKRIYLLSATPVPKPMSMWGIGILLGQEWDSYRFRSTYYNEIRIGGMRRIWMPKKDEETKQRLADLIQKFGYTGGLTDFFDVPEQTHKVVEIEPSKEQAKAIAEMTFAEADPLVRRARLRTIENGVLYGKKIEDGGGKVDKMSNETKIFKSHKIDYILERALEFPKLLIFANYTAQIMEIEKALKLEGYEVSTLTGATKDRSFIRKVNDSPLPHIIIAQSSISSGYELPTFPCVIYASKSWRYVDYEQSLGRVLRSNHLKKNLYIHLVVKGCDMDCHKAIMSGADFQEKLTLNI